jgi:hypothetical protein
MVAGFGWIAHQEKVPVSPYGYRMETGDDSDVRLHFLPCRARIEQAGKAMQMIFHAPDYFSSQLGHHFVMICG